MRADGAVKAARKELPPHARRSRAVVHGRYPGRRGRSDARLKAALAARCLATADITPPYVSLGRFVNPGTACAAKPAGRGPAPPLRPRWLAGQPAGPKARLRPDGNHVLRRGTSRAFRSRSGSAGEGYVAAPKASVGRAGRCDRSTASLPRLNVTPRRLHAPVAPTRRGLPRRDIIMTRSCRAVIPAHETRSGRMPRYAPSGRRAARETVSG
jgi:hypothetical protein